MTPCSRASASTSSTVPEFDWFERLVRSAPTLSEAAQERDSTSHPFDVRNIHPDLPKRARSLYDDGYYSEAVFEAFKFVEQEVKRLGGKGTGFALMMQAFDENKPVLAVNPLSTDTEKDEQRGYKHLFAGAQAALRNPRGHGTDLVDTPDACLDCLAVASVLIRRLDEAQLR